MEYCSRNGKKTTANDEAKPQQITLKEYLPFYLKRQKMKIYLEFVWEPNSSKLLPGSLKCPEIYL